MHEVDEKGNKLVKLETKDNLGSFPIGSRPTTSASFQSSKGKDWTTYNNPNAQIEKLLPRAMRAFYFIDGEFLENLASTFTGVKNSVEDISHINLVNYAIANIKKVTLTKLLKNSDILITSCDLNKSSFNLINKSKLALMKKTSGVINISRGGVINENDLYQFLKKEKIAFGALDVFLKEPINKQNKLINLKNCILSSHNAFNTAEEVRNVNINTLKNLFKGLKI